MSYCPVFLGPRLDPALDWSRSIYYSICISAGSTINAEAAYARMCHQPSTCSCYFQFIILIEVKDEVNQKQPVRVNPL